MAYIVNQSRKELGSSQTNMVAQRGKPFLAMGIQWDVLPRQMSKDGRACANYNSSQWAAKTTGAPYIWWIFIDEDDPPIWMLFNYSEYWFSWRGMIQVIMKIWWMFAEYLVKDPVGKNKQFYLCGFHRIEWNIVGYLYIYKIYTWDIL